MAHILVIDDEPAVRAVIVQMLQHGGHTVAQAGDGVEGLAAADIATPDLVITDIMMPNKEGIETIRDLRRKIPNLPILVISGNPGSTLYLQMATLLGAHRALSKPFRAAELLSAVKELIGPGANPA